MYILVKMVNETQGDGSVYKASLQKKNYYNLYMYVDNRERLRIYIYALYMLLIIWSSVLNVVVVDIER